MKKSLLFISVLFLAFSLNAQDASIIISKYLKVSGQAKLDKVECMILEGTINMPMMGMDIKYTIVKARPQNFRMDGEIAGGKMIQTYNGTSGWVYAPALGVVNPTEMSEDDIKNARSQASIDFPLYNYNEENNVELIGEEDFNNKSCYHLQTTSDEGQKSDYFINKDSYLLEGIAMSQLANGQEIHVTASFSDYKKVKGIQQPFTVTNKMEGQVMSIIKLNKISYTKGADPEQFGKPATE